MENGKQEDPIATTHAEATGTICRQDPALPPVQTFRVKVSMNRQRWA